MYTGNTPQQETIRKATIHRRKTRKQRLLKLISTAKISAQSGEWAEALKDLETAARYATLVCRDEGVPVGYWDIRDGSEN